MSASRFTPEVRGALLERVAAGVSMADACRAVGVREKTVKGWLTRGRREGAGVYADFAAAVEAARELARSRRPPMDADELARVVSDQARAGSVAAMKLRWEMLRADLAATAGSAPVAYPLAEVDELARKRQPR